jgi:hypothetical protein
MAALFEGKIKNELGKETVLVFVTQFLLHCSPALNIVKLLPSSFHYSFLVLPVWFLLLL